LPFDGYLQSILSWLKYHRNNSFIFCSVQRPLWRWFEISKGNVSRLGRIRCPWKRMPQVSTQTRPTAIMSPSIVSQMENWTVGGG